MWIDTGILDFIQTYLRCDLLDMAMSFITRLGNRGILWILTSLFLLIVPKTRKAGAAMAVSLGLELLCCNVVLKPLVARIRPCDVDSAVLLLIPHPGGFWSFCICSGGINWVFASLSLCALPIRCAGRSSDWDYAGLAGKHSGSIYKRKFA